MGVARKLQYLNNCLSILDNLLPEISSWTLRSQSQLLRQGASYSETWDQLIREVNMTSVNDGGK